MTGPEMTLPEMTLPGITLPAISGLDTATGLRRMMGNATIYLSILRKFADRQEPTRREIAELRQTGDREAAERLAHTIKGSPARSVPIFWRRGHNGSRP